MKSRAEILQALRDRPEVDVLVIGGGVNGIGVYRELVLQGLRVLLVEKADYCSGASAASSHMLHGGIRYLEYGDVRLVREALHERNRLLKNAPHYAKPLPTTIPIFRWFSGVLTAPLKFIGVLDRPAERGAVVIKLGLILYDWLTGSQQTMPFHRMRWRKSSLAVFPQLNPAIICTSTYYDAWMPFPERICIDMLVDADVASETAFALNYAPVVDGADDAVVIQDELSGETFAVKPTVVINAAGPWIDYVNRTMQQPTHLIGGTKGSHLILDHPELLAATQNSEIFFENSDGRIVLILPFHNRVMLGTTDIRIENPDEVVCTEEEVNYILESVKRVFPDILVNRTHIVYRFSGVRPLAAKENTFTGAISRDHTIQVIEPNEKIAFPVYSLVSGKWTTFRAFSEQAADRVLQRLDHPRQINTKNLAIGGGKDFPTTEDARAKWLSDQHAATDIPIQRLAILLNRYGTRAKDIAQAVQAQGDTPLECLPDYSQREILTLVAQEHIVHLDDLLMRRTLIGMLDAHVLKPAALEEIANLLAPVLHWDKQRKRAEIERVVVTYY